MAVVEVIEIIAILAHREARAFEPDALGLALRLRHVLQVDVAFEQLGQGIVVGDAAGGDEEALAALLAAYQEGLARQVRDLIAVGMPEEIEVRKGELGYAVGEHVQGRIELVAHLKAYRGEFGVLGYFHSDEYTETAPRLQAKRRLPSAGRRRGPTVGLGPAPPRLAPRRVRELFFDQDELDPPILPAVLGVGEGHDRLARA